MDEIDEEAERQRAIIGLISALLSAGTVLLAVYPDAPERLFYRAQLWLAHRDQTNYGRLRYERRRAEATGQTADRVIPAE